MKTKEKISGSEVRSPEQMYDETRAWKSDLEFYKDDLLFLHHLIDNYFIWMIRKDNVDEVRKMMSGLMEMDAQSAEMLAKVAKHMAQLGTLAEKSDAEEERIAALEHQHLAREMHEFVARLRKQRRKIFGITELVVDQKKWRKLLT